MGLSMISSEVLIGHILVRVSSRSKEVLNLLCPYLTFQRKKFKDGVLKQYFINFLW